MVVKVDGGFDDDDIHGTATEITYKDNLEGPVDSITDIDATTKQAVVLGQTVILDMNQTHFENTTFNTLAVGNVIEVSGLLDDAGQIRATFVEKKADSFTTGTEIEVKGTIQNLNSSAMTFQINALTVNYASATELPSGGPANGQYVEVKGTSYSGGTLTATKVETDDDTLGVSDAGKVEMEGLSPKSHHNPNSRSALRRCRPPDRRSLRMVPPVTSPWAQGRSGRPLGGWGADCHQGLVPLAAPVSPSEY